MKQSGCRLTALLLFLAMLCGLWTPPALAAEPMPTSESGKTEDGVTYTIKYPKIYGTIQAKLRIDDGVQTLRLPVVASGDAFVLTFTGGLTCARCPDCDKPPSEPKTDQASSPNFNGTIYDGPCIHAIMVDGRYEINGEDNFEKDTFEWMTNMAGYLSETPNTLLLDHEKDSVGLRRLSSMMIDPDPDFSYAPGNVHYDPQVEQTAADAYGFTFELGYYLRLPERTIQTMDFSKSYQTKDLEALIQGGPVADTVNRSKYETVGFETVNPTGAWDAFSSYHQVSYRLVNATAGVDRVDLAIIPCVLGADFDFDGSLRLDPDAYYPLPVLRIERTLQPGETVRDSWRPQWGFESDLLKYVVIRLEPGDMDLLQQNGIGELDNALTYHPSRRTEAGNRLASDFVEQYFSDYLR